MQKYQQKSKKNISTTTSIIIAFGTMLLLKATSGCLNLDTDFVLTNFGSLSNYKNYTDTMGLKTAYYTILTSIICAIFIHKITLKKYSKSIINYKYYPLLFIGLFVQLFIGYGIGSEIIPSFLFFDYLQHNISTYIVFAIHIILALFAFIVFTLFATYAIILTDKEILTIIPFIKQKTIIIKDIKNIAKTDEGYEIFSINGEMISLKFGRAKDKCYKILMKIMKDMRKN